MTGLGNSKSKILEQYRTGYCPQCGTMRSLEIVNINDIGDKALNPNYSQPPHSMSQSIHSQARVCRRYAAYDCDCVVVNFIHPRVKS